MSLYKKTKMLKKICKPKGDESLKVLAYKSTNTEAEPTRVAKAKSPLPEII